MLLALRALQEARFAERDRARGVVVVVAGASGAEGEEDRALERKEVGEKVRAERQKGWRLSVEGKRAVVDTVVVGMGYLL